MSTSKTGRTSRQNVLTPLETRRGDSKFRILSLDGGGIKGTYTAAVLAQFEEQLERPLLDCFDLVVGTSAGGIIALGLGCGLEAKRILELFQNQGARIFPPARSGAVGLLSRIFSTKFENDDLTQVLGEYLPNRRFMEIEPKVAITSFDATCATPVVFKSYYPMDETAYRELGVVEVALATSAAPTLFPAADVRCGIMIDGGVWANCPVMVGITDALSMFKKRVQDIHVLSIGTTSSPTLVTEDMKNGGLLHWALPVPSILMHAAKLGALGQARKLCKSLIRVDTEVVPDHFSIDDADAVDDLARFGRQAGRTAWEAVRKEFFAKPNMRKARP